MEWQHILWRWLLILAFGGKEFLYQILAVKSWRYALEPIILLFKDLE